MGQPQAGSETDRPAEKGLCGGRLSLESRSLSPTFTGSGELGIGLPPRLTHKTVKTLTCAEKRRDHHDPAKIPTPVKLGYVSQGRYRPGELAELAQNELNSGGETRMV